MDSVFAQTRGRIMMGGIESLDFPIDRIVQLDIEYPHNRLVNTGQIPSPLESGAVCLVIQWVCLDCGYSYSFKGLIGDSRL